MAGKKTGRTNAPGAGRPRLELDEDKIKALAGIHCTMEEIAAIMQCSVDTLENNFSDIIKEAKESGRASLRRQQWLLAQKGNVAMAIWLGKQLLGQRDRVENEMTHNYPRPTIIEKLDGTKVMLGFEKGLKNEDT